MNVIAAAAASDPTVFQWFSEIEVPTLLGLGTLSVGVAAVMIAKRSSDTETRRRDEDERSRSLAERQALADEMRVWMSTIPGKDANAIRASDGYKALKRATEARGSA